MAELPAPTETTTQTARHSRPWYAFGIAIPIGVLGGLIGLGGAEFRLPVLAGPLGYIARRAVALNVAISLITVLASLAIRGGTLTFAPIAPLLFPMGAIIAGALVTAFIGTSLVGRLSNERLEQVILVFLVTIGSRTLSERISVDIPCVFTDASTPSLCDDSCIACNQQHSFAREGLCYA